jgi:3-hydroxymyristoyl/3-hydroxydecanoyl-(acyl carrier protein) dehydratase
VLAPDHPAADGHFPGNPIIPGAVLLAEALRAMTLHLGVALQPCRIRSAKFPHAARPGARMAIEFSGDAASGLRFRCTVAGAMVLSAEVQCPPLRAA